MSEGDFTKQKLSAEEIGSVVDVFAILQRFHGRLKKRRNREVKRKGISSTICVERVSCVTQVSSSSCCC